MKTTTKTKEQEVKNHDQLRKKEVEESRI